MRTRSKFGVSMTDKGKQDRTCLDYYTGEPILFDSKLEKKYYEQVIVPGLEDGSIKLVERQKKYQLQPSFRYDGKLVRAIDYISDFTVTYTNGEVLVVDIKGQPTTDANLKKKMMHYKYPDLKFVWLAYTVTTGWIEYDDLKKIRREKKKAERELAASVNADDRECVSEEKEN